MSIIHGGANLSSLRANIDIYNQNLELYGVAPDQKEDPHLIFFRRFFFLFLDLDPIHFEKLMDNLGHDLFRFFDNISHCMDGEDVSFHECLRLSDNLTSFFTRSYQQDPIFFVSLHMLVKKLNDVPTLEELPIPGISSEFREVPSAFWTPGAGSLVCFFPVAWDPDAPTDSDNEEPWKHFFNNLLKELEAFYQKMKKISYQEWEDIFNAFYDNFKNCHFLNLMEMTDEYFNKIERSHLAEVERKRAEFDEEEEED